MALPKHIKCIITYANYLKDGWKKEGAVAIVHLMTALPKVNAWHLAEKDETGDFMAEIWE